MAQQLSRGLSYLQGTKEFREYEDTIRMGRTSPHARIVDTLNRYELGLEDTVKRQMSTIMRLKVENCLLKAKLKEYGIS